MKYKIRRRQVVTHSEWKQMPVYHNEYVLEKVKYYKIVFEVLKGDDVLATYTSEAAAKRKLEALARLPKEKCA